MKHLFSFFTIVLLFGSCSYPCGQSEGLHLNFVSFSKQEIYNFSIGKYAKGSNFSNLIGTISFDSARLGIDQQNDTIGFYLISADLLLPSAFDYKIQVPSTNSTYLITDLQEPQKTGIKNGQKIYCMNMIESCKVNGADVKITDDQLYLKK